MNKEQILEGIRAIPDWAVIAGFVVSLLLAVNMVKTTFFSTASVKLAPPAWVCTDAKPDGITAVCTRYERRAGQ